MSSEAEHALLEARARVLHDLSMTGCDTARTVDVLDRCLAERRAWLAPWPDGSPYVTCLLAQDVQESLLELVGRWPACPFHESHALHVDPDLGDDPHWVCEEDGVAVAPVGHL